jgi:hypothetical protein
MNTYRIEIESWTAAKPVGNGYKFQDVKKETVAVKGYRLACATAIQAKHKLGAMSCVILRGPDGFGFAVTDKGVKRGRR